MGDVVLEKYWFTKCQGAIAYIQYLQL